MRELTIFYVGLLLFTSVATALLWELPPDFRTGDVGAVRRAVNGVGGVVILGPVLTAIIVTWAFCSAANVRRYWVETMTCAAARIILTIRSGRRSVRTN